MKIGVIVYAFNLVEPLDALLFRLLIDDIRQHVYLFLHSQNPGVVAVCEKYAHHPNVHYYDYGTNRGLARSANEGFIDGYQRDGMDVMLTCNDDVLPGAGDIWKIAIAAKEHRECWLVDGHGLYRDREEAIGISCAAINPIAFETIGYFDENFIPAYYEDTDYFRRVRLAGMKQFTVQDTCIRHVGSLSLATVHPDVHNQQFLRIAQYYVKKWGGDYGHELFDRPFNDPQFDLNIRLEDRHLPYPGYNTRTLEAIYDPARITD